MEKRQDKFRARLHKIDDKPLKKFDIPKETSAKKILNDLEGAEYKVSDVQKKETRKNPAPPFITSTLQQECARKLGYSAKQTMMIAQQLYEGINLKDEGSTGLITYMRTDSVALANEALESIKQIIVKKYGAKYGLPEPRRYKVKAKRGFTVPLNIGKFNILAFLGILSAVFMMFNLEAIVAIAAIGLALSGFVAYYIIKNFNNHKSFKRN